MQRLVFNRRLIKIIARLRQVCWVCFLAIAIQAAATQTTTVKFGPPDGWVKPQIFDQQSSASPTDSSADDYLLLQERQINTLQNETFFHSDRKILTMAGVQKDATLTIDFNPAYQSLIFHWVRIWRDGQYLDRLDTNKVQILQREQDLDEAMLNGEKSAVFVLDDVRVGDIVDYSYSIRGNNPVFDGHFFSVVPVQTEQPADRLMTRLLWPSKKGLFITQHGCSVRPTAVIGKDQVEYVWDVRQEPGIDLEDSLPEWCDPDSWVQMSDFKTWGAVNQWALALFQVTSPFSPEMSRKIREWKQIPGQEQQTLAVLRFVQDDVRYFGIEIGNSAEKPADPSAVFSRRYGDCKDKSLLFVTILRALGIEAYPVLVNAECGRAIENWQPSAAAFDHCIAMLQCNGQIYWLDPTINYQRGPLAAHYLPAYERGLVIAPRTTGLTVIPQTTGLPLTTTTEYFQIRRRTEPSDLKVVTVAQGRDADILRDLFATTKRSEIEKNYTHFYAGTYSGIKMSSPIVINDDEQQNTFQTTEFYTIDNVWAQPNAKERKFECEFYPSSLNSFLKKPVDTERKQPLGISFPEHQILRTEATLPQDWPSGTDDKTIYDPAFTFRKDIRCAGNRLVLEYEYQSLADSVFPDQVSQYLDHLNQISQSLDYVLIWR